MSGTYQYTIVLGRLGRDPELRYTPNGTPVATLNLATDESYKDKDGVVQSRTEWHRVNVWGKQAENANQYLSKGRLCLVEGRLRTNKWQDKEGKDRYTTEIRASRVVFMPGGSQNGQPAGPQQGAAQPQGGGGQKRSGWEPEDDLGPAFPSESENIDEAPF